MPANPISRYVEDFDCVMAKTEVKAQRVFDELKASIRDMVPYEWVNGLVNPEERQANKEETKRRWGEEQEESFCDIVGGGVD